MAFKIIPTSIAGVQLPFNQLKGPLSKLFSNSENNNSLYYPQDIGNNPAHCHVVQISIYEYTTELGEVITSAADALSKTTKDDVLNGLKNDVAAGKAGAEQALAAIQNGDTSVLTDKLLSVGSTLTPIVKQVGAAKTYKPQKKGSSLANISLYMPDTLNVNYNAGYTEVQMTQTLGRAGFISSAISEGITPQDISGKSGTDLMKQFGSTGTAKNLGIQALGKAGSAIGMTGAEEVAGQALGQIINPQLQLLYTGVDFRTFTLEFVFTPKSSAEAETTKQIIDTLVYYSSPGLAGKNTNDQQRYLAPPQLFDIKFLFTGKNGIAGALSSIFDKALTNIGLDFLTNKQGDLASSKSINEKLFSIGECVLMDVNVDYAPNGWAAFSDGHPVQTRMVLTFKETNIVTKDRLLKEGSKAVGVSK